jgi:hypothetical protein
VLSGSTNSILTSNGQPRNRIAAKLQIIPRLTKLLNATATIKPGARLKIFPCRNFPPRFSYRSSSRSLPFLQFSLLINIPFRVSTQIRCPVVVLERKFRPASTRFMQHGPEAQAGVGGAPPIQAPQPLHNGSQCALSSAQVTRRTSCLSTKHGAGDIQH